jgi:probable aminopeptidase NPEPL1
VADLGFPTTLSGALKGAHVAFVLLPEAQREKGWLEAALDVPWRPLLEKGLADKEAGPNGKTFTFVNPGEGPDRIVVTLLPDRVSRHNAPSRADAAMAAARSAELAGLHAAVVACVEAPEHAPALALAVARALPLFDRKTNGTAKGGKRRKKGHLAFLALDENGAPVSLSRTDKAEIEAARWAASLVDTPTADLTTADFERAVRKAARGIEHLRITTIKGGALLEHGLGGIHAVGRAAMVAPRMVVLEYRPPKAKRTVALVGKGVVYDTGGLSLKPSAAMAGMKKDMGGAAAVAGATLALARSKAPHGVVGVLPMAENAIGPDSYRPDDILKMHSGKTVEINNTDAEGRLLLGDAVSWVARKKKPAMVADAATLTGAQLVSTGLRHAAVVSNREGLERLAVEVGRATGELTHPLPFAPEFFQEEFRSKLADMKNSVANRMNAQTSCAAQFVYSHIQELDVPWLHVDLAGPAARDERATGFGVALLAEIVRRLTPADLEQ